MGSLDWNILVLQYEYYKLLLYFNEVLEYVERLNQTSIIIPFVPYSPYTSAIFKRRGRLLIVEKHERVDVY